MEIKISKKDIISGYIAQFFQYGTGVIILPVVLNRLSAEEVGMNYVMLSVGALANMVDFGFSGQIGRNITYVLSGANKIYREGIEQAQRGDTVDFKLLKIIIDASKYLYRRLSFAVLLLLLTFGTLYMHHATEGFTNVDNSLITWILYAASTFFNLYFLYYNSLLTGAALIKEQRFAMIFSRIAYIIISIVLIFTGFGLMSIVIANLISPFIARYYSYIKFYSGEIKKNLPKEKSGRQEVRQAISDIWVTAKKSGTNTIGHYVGQQGGMFVAGLFLTLAVTAKWGLMTQVFGVVQALATNIGSSYYPEYCSLRLKNESEALIKKSSFAMASMVILLVLGGAAIIVAGPFFLKLIKSQTELPDIGIMVAYVIYLIVLCNAQQFAMLMTSRNVIPSPLAVIITSVCQILLTIVLIDLLKLGIWGLLLGPFVSGLCYTSWAWMRDELRNMQVSFVDYYRSGIREMNSRIVLLIKHSR